MCSLVGGSRLPPTHTTTDPPYKWSERRNSLLPLSLSSKWRKPRSALVHPLLPFLSSSSTACLRSMSRPLLLPRGPKQRERERTGKALLPLLLLVPVPSFTYHRGIVLPSKWVLDWTFFGHDCFFYCKTLKSCYLQKGLLWRFLCNGITVYVKK